MDWTICILYESIREICVSNAWQKSYYSLQIRSLRKGNASPLTLPRINQLGRRRVGYTAVLRFIWRRPRAHPGNNIKIDTSQRRDPARLELFDSSPTTLSKQGRKGWKSFESNSSYYRRKILSRVRNASSHLPRFRNFTGSSVISRE